MLVTPDMLVKRKLEKRGVRIIDISEIERVGLDRADSKCTDNDNDTDKNGDKDGDKEKGGDKVLILGRSSDRNQQYPEMNNLIFDNKKISLQHLQILKDDAGDSLIVKNLSKNGFFHISDDLKSINHVSDFAFIKNDEFIALTSTLTEYDNLPNSNLELYKNMFKVFTNYEDKLYFVPITFKINDFTCYHVFEEMNELKRDLLCCFLNDAYFILQSNKRKRDYEDENANNYQQHEMSLNKKKRILSLKDKTEKMSKLASEMDAIVKDMNAGCDSKDVKESFVDFKATILGGIVGAVVTVCGLYAIGSNQG